MNLKLNRQGFITNYLVSGPKLTPLIDNYKDDNQLRYEKYLRSVIAVHRTSDKKDDVRLGEKSELGMEWAYYYSFGNWFVDKSSFYSLLTKVELVVAVNLYVEENMEVPAYIWSYGAIDLWLNEVHTCKIETPVYKPITQQKMMLKLQKGENTIYVKMQNLGVRDTRNIFGIQILERQDEMVVQMPDGVHAQPYIEAETWLSGITLKGHSLDFPSVALQGTTVGYDSKTTDFTLADQRIVTYDISGLMSIKLENNQPNVCVTVSVADKTLSRKFEVIEDYQPEVVPEISIEDNLKVIFNKIADVIKTDRGEDMGFSMSNILARCAVNRIREDDIDYIYETLDQIENRIDCSDFLVCALIRYIKTYPIDAKLSARVKQVLLNYRYWMDEIGSDAMCFWSENHSLMFYISAMNAGELYPNDVFSRSKLSGSALHEKGRRKVLEWLEDIESNGFEEFLSGGYMCVTFAALLNTIDYSDRQLSESATKITDQLLMMLATHTFKGSVIAPQGRVYRDVIYPFAEGVQALINMLNPQMYAYGEGWLAFYATSKYELPTDLIHLMKQPIITEYQTGNALIRLNKNKEYVMTSVQSPREDKGFRRWENISFEQVCDINSHEYVKSLNERYHGTTCFEPGVYGYQQHMWSAALQPDTIVFVNHPGATCEDSSMRPGYWYGNGVMPAVKQVEQAIGSVYVIPPHYPIHFTHIHWANVRFDEMKNVDHWLVGKKGSGYIGIWCSGEMEIYNDQIYEAEYRVHSDEVAYLCVCSSSVECASLDAFITFCKAFRPEFNRDTLTLTAKSDYSLQYIKTEDGTQYI